MFVDDLGAHWEARVLEGSSALWWMGVEEGQDGRTGREGEREEKEREREREREREIERERDRERERERERERDHERRHFMSSKVEDAPLDEVQNERCATL